MITYVLEHRQKYDHVISKSKFIQMALEYNFRKPFGFVHRGYTKKIDWLVPSANTNSENHLMGFNVKEK